MIPHSYLCWRYRLGTKSSAIMQNGRYHGKLFFCLFNPILRARFPYFRSLNLQSTCHWRRNVERHHGKFRDTTYKFISISIKPFSPRTFRVSFLYNYCHFERRFPLHRLLQNDLELREDDDFKCGFTDCSFRSVGIFICEIRCRLFTKVWYSNIWGLPCYMSPLLLRFNPLIAILRKISSERVRKIASQKGAHQKGTHQKGAREEPARTEATRKGIRYREANQKGAHRKRARKGPAGPFYSLRSE